MSPLLLYGVLRLCSHSSLSGEAVRPQSRTAGHHSTRFNRKVEDPKGAETIHSDLRVLRTSNGERVSNEIRSESTGADERTRTSNLLREPAPQAGAYTNSATSA